jgi:hypothetical protein
LSSFEVTVYALLYLCFVPEEPSNSTPTKTKRDFGGSWRLYCSEQKRGCVGTPSFSSREYHALPAQEKLRLRTAGNKFKAIGQAMTRVASRSTFGVRPRYAKRKAEVALREQSFTLRVIGDSAEPCRVQTIVDSARASSGGSVDKALCAARSMQRLDANQKKRLERENAVAVQEFESTVGAESLSKVTRAVPLGSSSLLLQPVPAGAGNCFGIGSCLDNVRVANSWATASNKKSRLGTNLGRFCKGSCALLLEKECLPLPVTPAPALRCINAGMCIHEGLGKRVDGMYTNFLVALRASFPKGGAARSMMVDGFIVVQIRQVSLEAPDDVLVMPRDVPETFFHIGFLSEKPLRPTFFQVRRDDSDAGRPHPEKLQVKAVSF